MQILFRYMLCYNVIILIQILIRYNVKNLITRFWPQNWKISLPWEGGHPPPRPSHLSLFHSVPPPPCVDPRYATASEYSNLRNNDPSE